jgi:glutamate-1-semialdehyde 2,1-aminomutase
MSELFEVAKQLMPGGVNSPVRSFKHIGIPPVYFKEASGPYLYDTEGKRYTDFCLAFGPHLIGHSDPGLIDCLTQQLSKGIVYGACHEGEITLAQLVQRIFPFIDKVRFLSTGTEAAMTAIRLARAYTGRDKLIKFNDCYHGHSDGLLVKSGSGVKEYTESNSKGVPAHTIADTISIPFLDLATLEETLKANKNQIAAIALEPIPANNGLWIPTYDQIKKLFQLAKEHGALVLFDEVVSGFRVGLSGASGYYDVNPDLVILGKVLGGGLPIAAVGAKKEIMDLLAPMGPVYQAGTFSANSLSVAASIYTLEYLIKNKAQYSKLDKLTEAFTQELQALLKNHFSFELTQINSIFWLNFQSDFKRFYVEALKQGIYFSPSPYEVNFLSFAHTEQVLSETLEKIKKCNF